MKKMLYPVRDQLVLILLSLPLGAATGAVCALFGRVLLLITDFRSEHYLFLLPFLGVAGAALVWCYGKFGGDAGKGMSLLYEVDQNKRTKTPLRLVPMVIASTWITHLFGGAAGREGVAVQIGGVLGNQLGSRIKIADAGRLMMIAGMAAGFGGLFRTPIAAAFFSVEVLTVGALELSALLPSLTAAYTACFVSGALGLGKFTVNVASEAELNLLTALKLVILGLAFGLIGRLFSHALAMLKRRFAAWIPNPVARIAGIGTVVGLLSVLGFGGRYSGLGTNLISAGFSGGILPWDFIAKLLFTVITLAAGFYGGEVTPLFSIGVSLGCVMAALLGLPAELCAALGYAAVFGSATRTLIAPICIGLEVFGFGHLPMLMIVCAAARLCSGKYSIYSLQRVLTREK